MNAKILELAGELAKFSNQTRFISLVYRSKSTGELARHTVLVGAHYLNKVTNALLAVNLLLQDSLSEEDARVALELRDSLQNTLLRAEAGRTNDMYTKKDTYTYICPGLSLHKINNTLEIRGYLQSKVIIEPGEFKIVNHRPATLLKNKIRERIGFDNYRSYCINAAVIAKLNGQTIELEAA